MADDDGTDLAGSLDPRPDGWSGDQPAGDTPDTVTETTSRNWFGRLGDAIVGVLIGLLLVAGTCIGLFWNEGRAVQTSRSLAEGSGLVVDVPAARVDPANEGRLIHLAGDLATGADLVDLDLGVTARAARLARKVEMFQWKEESQSSSQKKLGGGEETTTTTTYTRTWSDRRIDSSRFRNPSGHANPQPRFGESDVTARDATLGAFRPGGAALRAIPASQDLTVPAAALDRIRARLGPVSVQDGRLFLGRDPANPAVGDLRVSYRIVPEGPASLIGRQTGGDITAFQTKAGDQLLMGETGLVPADAMFRSAAVENTILTWAIRLACAIFMWMGWFLLLRPIAVAGDLVPLIGSVLAAGAGLAAFLLTVVTAPLVAAIAWLFYRPVVSLALLAAGGAIVLALRRLAARRRISPPTLRPTARPA